MGIPGPEPDFWMGNAKQLTYGRVVCNISKWFSIQQSFSFLSFIQTETD